MIYSPCPSPTKDIASGKSALRLCQPWVLPCVYVALFNLVQPDWHVFEWGAGASTVWYASHCEHVLSIEHDPRWLYWTTARLRERKLIHRVLLSFRSDPGEYVNDIHDEPVVGAGMFDLISVDGLEQEACVNNALAKVKPGGYLMVNRPTDVSIQAVPIGWTETRYETSMYFHERRPTVWRMSLFRRPKESYDD